MFYSGLLTLLFTLGSKQGTLKRTFGGDDEDDEDEEEDEDDGLANDPKRSFGTGISTITIVATIGTALSIVFAEPISDGLLGDARPEPDRLRGARRRHRGALPGHLDRDLDRAPPLLLHRRRGVEAAVHARRRRSRC